MPHDARVTTKAASLQKELNDATSIREIITPRVWISRHPKTKAGIISALSLAALAVFGAKEAKATCVPPTSGPSSGGTSPSPLSGPDDTYIVKAFGGGGLITGSGTATLNISGGGSFTATIAGCGPAVAETIGFYTTASDSETYTETWTADQGSAVSANLFGPFASPKNFGPNNPDCSADTCDGDPINTATGNLYEVETDYVGGLSTHLELKRYYNSLEPLLSPFGTNWRSTYDRSIQSAGAGSTYAQTYRPDGRIDSFRLVAGAWVSDPDVTSTLTAVMTGGTQTGWQVVLKDDTTENYNISGQLTSIVTRAGLTTTLAYNANNQLATVTGPFGHTLTYAYNANGNVSSITAPDGGVYSYAYALNSNGTYSLTSVTYPDSTTRQYAYGNPTCAGTFAPSALTGLTDENGSQYSTWTYDANCRVTSSQHAGGVDLTTITYNSDGTVTVTDPRSNTHTYSYTTQYGLIKTSALTGAPVQSVGGKSFSYDTNGFIESKTDYDNNVTDYAHDTRGDLTSEIEAYGTPIARTTTTTWETTFHLPALITEPTRTIGFTYDANGNMLTRTVTDTATGTSRTWTDAYNSYGQVLTEKGPRTDVNQTTAYTYDSKGDLATATNALGQETQYTSYDANGRLLSMTDPNGLVTAFTYDLRGRLKSRTVGSEVTAYTYDNAGNLTKVTNPDGSALTYTYDAAHRLTQVTDSRGNTITYTLDNADNVTAVNVYDPSSVLHRTRTYAYDNVNNLIESAGAYSGETTAYTYDSNGNRMSATDGMSDKTSWTYDALNRVGTITDPVNQGTGLSTAMTYSPDTLNLVSQVTSPRGVVTQYAYDGFGDRLTTGSQDSGLTTKTYDLAGNVATSKDANANTTTYTYDALNRIKTASYQDGTQRDFYYDSATNAVGRLKSIADTIPTSPGDWTFFGYDQYGHVISKQNYMTSQNYIASYNATTGQLTSEIYPSGMVVSYKYDAAGQESEVDDNSTPFITSVTHEPFGPANGWNWYANTTAYARTFDQDGRLTSYPLAGDTRNITYDLASRVTEVADSSVTQTYGYDADSRITSYAGPFGNGNQTLTYDADGNRTGITTSAGAETDAIQSTSNRLVSRTLGSTVTNYTSDAAGNVTAAGSMTYTYDARNQEASVTAGGVTADSYYNGLNELIQKNSPSVYRSFYAPAAFELTSPRELGSYIIYGGANGDLQETIYLDGALPVGVTATGGTGVNYTNTMRVYAGNLNEPRRVTDQSLNLYWTWDSDAFGAGAANDNPAGMGTLYFDLRFPGQSINTEDNTHWNFTRSYDPATGRYIQSDKSGLNGGINTYAYAGNNPSKNIDPTGMDWNIVQYAPRSIINPFGHSGIGAAVPNSSVPTIGFYPVNDSSGWDKLWGNPVPGVEQWDTGESPVTTFTLQTTPFQDLQIAAYLQSVINNNPDYKTYSNNCDQTIAKELRSAGIPVSQDVKTPQQLTDWLQQYQPFTPVPRSPTLSTPVPQP